MTDNPLVTALKGPTVAEVEPPKAERAPKMILWLNRRSILLITVVVSGLVYSQFGFWKMSTRGDRANWDYFAQVISRGGVAYRDVVNIKSPLSAYIGAGAIAATRPFGLRDAYAIRLAYLALAILTVCMTFVVASDYFGGVWTGVLAAAVMLGFNAFSTLNSGGVQPKTPMVLFGLISLWAVFRDRPFVAGVFGMLSCLSWQPGLLFVGAAGLAFSKYLTSWRDKKVLKLLLGAAAPLIIMLLYFWVEGALKEFYAWTVHYNYTVYGPRGVRRLSDALRHVVGLLYKAYRGERYYFYMSVAGAAVAVFWFLKEAKVHGLRRLLEQAPRHAVVIASVVYFVFCLIDIQGGADMIPSLPFVGIFTAVVFVLAVDLAAKVTGKFAPNLNIAAFKHTCCAAVLVAIFYFTVVDAFSYRRPPPTLQDQYAAVAEITSHLEPGDRVFVHGQTEVLVLSGLTNSSKYFFLDRGKDRYLNKVEPGGFDQWFETVKAGRPKVVALSRLRAMDRGDLIRAWVNENYEVCNNGVFRYYLRKD
ncbi:MAG TPA: DolP-mannose mannosyltransferase [Blastocatellia bacterium]|nr:DolP-mannose mannosyltransferase [Blastocatellia bacterium]